VQPEAVRLALAGDTMLGRGVAARLATVGPGGLFAPGVVETARESDLFVLNLECAISERGSPWPNPYKPFFFRAPPVATEALRHLGVDCVTLANNHALDFGTEALRDTLRHLAAAGIATVGAGACQAAARRPAIFERGGTSVGIVGVTDHPAEFAAGPDRPGVGFADLRATVPGWLLREIGGVGTDVVLVTPHWGPNMVPSPVAHVRAAARALRQAGATLVAGHSAHVFHGVEDAILYDLGDFIDDYAINPSLRNDRSLLFLVTVEAGHVTCIEAVPLALDFGYTRLAEPAEAAWIARRFRRACADLGTEVVVRDGRLVIDWPTSAATI
jgi:poly-gamma-glutamate capsule biosynthesis protein CapA/YwtB (metallophosphatase superfamily)